MQDIQEIFNRIQVAKKKKKDLQATYKDALSVTAGYEEVSDKLKTLKAQKKEIEIRVREQLGSELTKLEDITIDLESDQELLSDIAVSKLMKGETVEIKDEHNQEYEPVVMVKFKKVN